MLYDVETYKYVYIYICINVYSLHKNHSHKYHKPYLLELCSPPLLSWGPDTLPSFMIIGSLKNETCPPGSSAMLTGAW